VPIGRTIAESWPFLAKFRVDCMNCRGDMTVFDFSKWRQSAILDFEKFEFLTARPVRRAIMRHQAKFGADQSNCCRDMAVVFNFSRWRRPPSWIF